MAEPDVSQLMTVAQAMAVIDAAPVAPRVVRMPLAAAMGRRLAHDVAADRDYPPFNKSTMDGFAVRSGDIARPPATLRVTARVPAGTFPDTPLAPGEAMAIMTGAPLPAGADGVVPVEDAEESDGTVRINRSDGVTRFVSPRGADCQKGRVVLAKGALLGPAQLAVAAAVGAAEVDVFDAPRAAVLATGDELVPADKAPQPAQIRNSNNVMLAGLLRRFGCAVTDLGIAPDHPDDIRLAISRALHDHDVLLVSGGMSMGEHDHVPRVLQDLGVTLKVSKLRIKPGKPFVFGVRHEGTEARRHEGGADDSSLRASVPDASVPSAFVFGLPGNPVSGFVCAVRLVSRLIDRLSGVGVQERWQAGRLLTGLPANGPREFYMPVLRSMMPGRVSAQAVLPAIKPLEWKGSGDLFTLAAANALLVRAANEPPLPDGTLVRVLEI